MADQSDNNRLVKDSAISDDEKFTLRMVPFAW